MSKVVHVFEYKVKVISPMGMRVKGDDITDKLSNILELECNKLSKHGWRIISILPTISSEGAVSKLMVTFERHKK